MNLGGGWGEMSCDFSPKCVRDSRSCGTLTLGTVSWLFIPHCPRSLQSRAARELHWTQSRMAQGAGEAATKILGVLHSPPVRGNTCPTRSPRCLSQARRCAYLSYCGGWLPSSVDEGPCALAKTDRGQPSCSSLPWAADASPTPHVRARLQGDRWLHPLSPRGHQRRARQVTSVIESSSERSGLQPVILRGWVQREEAPRGPEELHHGSSGVPKTRYRSQFSRPWVPWTRLLKASISSRVKMGIAGTSPPSGN